MLSGLRRNLLGDTEALAIPLMKEVNEMNGHYRVWSDFIHEPWVPSKPPTKVY